LQRVYALALCALNRVGEIGRRPDVPEAEKQRLKDIAERIGDLFSRVTELSESQPTAKELIEQLIASHDRLREELAKANALLDHIAKPKA